MPDSTRTCGGRAGSPSILAGSLAGAALAVGLAGAQFDKRDELWRDPGVLSRIEEGIRAHRTGWIRVEIVDRSGAPVTAPQVDVELVRHEFLFGANGFMVEGFAQAQENREYEAAFVELFNYVTAPFYWKGLEPRLGTLRFERGSEPVYRRPSPDVVLEFARRHGLAVKAHPLVWDNPTHYVPEWLPAELLAREQALWDHVERILRRYRDEIQYWDVINEACSRIVRVPMPRDYVFRAFDLAARRLSPASILILNETTRVWREDRDQYSQFYLLAENLIRRGARVSALGLQFHFFGADELFLARDGKAFTPAQIFRVLDLYAQLGLPLHITEITIPTLPYTPDGERLQAALVRDYYRAWFSHPAVQAITWWNLVDGTAAPGEEKLYGGLLRRDFSRKPAYDALRRLIREEWATRARLSTDREGRLRFRGFYGIYRLAAQWQGRAVTTRFAHFKGGPNVVRVVVGENDL